MQNRFGAFDEDDEEDHTMHIIQEAKPDEEGEKDKKKPNQGTMKRITRKEWKKAREIDLNPLFLKPFNEDKSVTASPLMPLESRYKSEQRDGWTLVKAVPDSGALVTVGPCDMAPGYGKRASPGSLRGQCFVSASGDEIVNQGEQTTPVQSSEGI